MDPPPLCVQQKEGGAWDKVRTQPHPEPKEGEHGSPSTMCTAEGGGAWDKVRTQPHPEPKLRI